MNDILFGWFYGISDVSVRFGLLFLLVLLLSRIGRSNPHRQSILWRGVLISLLVMSIWSLAIPRLTWDIPVAAKTSDRVDRASNQATSNSSFALAPAAENVKASTKDLAFDAPDINRPNSNRANTPIALPSLGTNESVSFNAKLLIALFVIWFTVAAGLFVRIGYACIAIYALRRTTHRIENRNDHVYECAAIRSPMVAGILHPRILLPPQWKTWSPEKLRAVIAHEQSHIARYDLLFAFVAEVLTALYWFHPCLWLTKKYSRSSSELSCDYAAIRDGGDRYEYARILLDVASPTEEHRMLHLAMASRGQVRWRITEILSNAITANMHLTHRQRITLCVGLSVSLVLLCAWAPRLISQEAQRYLAKTYSLDERLTSKGNRPEITIHGVVLNPDGTLANDAQVMASTWGDLYYENKSIDKIECRQGRFELNVPGVTNVDILARNADSTLMAEHAISTVSMRTISENDLVIQLEESRPFTVTIKNLDPNESCTVTVGKAQSNYDAPVSNEGVATILIPAKPEVFSVSARTDKKRIGWQDFRPWRFKPFHDFKSSIELVETEPLQISLQDSAGQAVSNTKINTSSSNTDDVTVDPSFFAATTDAGGHATIDLVPKLENLKARFYINRAAVSSQDLKDRSITLTAPASAKAQVPFRGQLQLPPGCEGGLLISGRSFQHVARNLSTPFKARCDSNGYFEALATPGYTYSLYVDDPLWVSQNWDGILVGTDDQPGDRFRLAAESGVQAAISVTGGADNEPLSDREVELGLDHTFQWQEDGKTQYGGGGRSVSAKTDNKGKAVFTLFPGEYQLRCTNGQGFVEKKVQIAKGQPNTFELHFDVVGKRKISGKLVGDSGAIADATVYLRQADRNGEVDTTVKSNADGTFSGEIDANQTLIYAISKDNAYVATKLFNTVKDDFVIAMAKRGSLSAQVLDPENNPVSNGIVRVFVKLQNPRYQIGFSDIPEEIIVRRIETKTNNEGKFEIESLPSQTNILVTLDSGPNTFRYREQIVLQPGEHRTSVYDYKKRTELPFESRLSRLLNDTRLTHTRALVVIHSGDDKAKEFNQKHALNFEAHTDVTWYLPIAVDAKTLTDKPDTLASFQRRAWPTPKTDSLWLMVLDDQEKEMGRIELDVSNDVAQAESVSKLERFLRDHRVPELDASVNFDLALTEAKRNDRSLWVSISQTRCQPCFTMARW